MKTGVWHICKYCGHNCENIVNVWQQRTHTCKILWKYCEHMRVSVLLLLRSAEESVPRYGGGKIRFWSLCRCPWVPIRARRGLLAERKRRNEWWATVYNINGERERISYIIFKWHVYTMFDASSPFCQFGPHESPTFQNYGGGEIRFCYLQMLRRREKSIGVQLKHIILLARLPIWHANSIPRPEDADQDPSHMPFGIFPATTDHIRINRTPPN